MADRNVQSAIERLQSQLQNGESNRMATENRTLKKNLAEAQAELEQVKRTNALQKEELDAQQISLAELMEDFQPKAEELDAVRAALAKAQENEESYSNTLRISEEKYTELEEELEDAKERVASANKELESVKKRERELRKDLEARLRAAELNYSEECAQAEESNRINKTLRSEISTLEKELRRRNREVNDLKKDLNSANDVNRTVSAMRKEIESITAKNINYEHENTMMREKITRLQMAVAVGDEKDHELSNLRNQLNETNKKAEDVQAQKLNRIRGLLKEKSDLEREVSTLRADNEKLTRSLSDKTSVSEDRQANVEWQLKESKKRAEESDKMAKDWMERHSAILQEHTGALKRIEDLQQELARAKASVSAGGESAVKVDDDFKLFRDDLTSRLALSGDEDRIIQLELQLKEQEMDALRTKMEQRQTESKLRREFESRLVKLEEKNLALQQERQKAIDATTELEKSLDNVKITERELEAKHSNDFGSLQAEVETLRTRAERSETVAENMKQESRSLRKELDDAKLNFGNVESARVTLSLRCKDFQNELEKSRNAHGLEMAKADRAHQEAVQELQAKVDELQKEMFDDSIRLAEMKKKFMDKSNEAKQFEAQLSEEGNKALELERKITEKSSEVDALQTQILQSASDCLKYQREVDKISAQLTDNRTEFAKFNELKAELDAMSAAFSELKLLHAQKCSESAALEKQLASRVDNLDPPVGAPAGSAPFLDAAREAEKAHDIKIHYLEKCKHYRQLEAKVALLKTDCATFREKYEEMKRLYADKCTDCDVMAAQYAPEWAENGDGPSPTRKRSRLASLIRLPELQRRATSLRRQSEDIRFDAVNMQETIKSDFAVADVLMSNLPGLKRALLVPDEDVLAVDCLLEELLDCVEKDDVSKPGDDRTKICALNDHDQQNSTEDNIPSSLSMDGDFQNSPIDNFMTIDDAPCSSENSPGADRLESAPPLVPPSVSTSSSIDVQRSHLVTEWRNEIRDLRRKNCCAVMHLWQAEKSWLRRRTEWEHRETEWSRRDADSHKRLSEYEALVKKMTAKMHLVMEYKNKWEAVKQEKTRLAKQLEDGLANSRNLSARVAELNGELEQIRVRSEGLRFAETQTSDSPNSVADMTDVSQQTDDELGQSSGQEAMDQDVCISKSVSDYAQQCDPADVGFTEHGCPEPNSDSLTQLKTSNSALLTEVTDLKEKLQVATIALQTSKESTGISEVAATCNSLSDSEVTLSPNKKNYSGDVEMTQLQKSNSELFSEVNVLKDRLGTVERELVAAQQRLNQCQTELSGALEREAKLKADTDQELTSGAELLSLAKSKITELSESRNRLEAENQQLLKSGQNQPVSDGGVASTPAASSGDNADYNELQEMYEHLRKEKLDLLNDVADFQDTIRDQKQELTTLRAEKAKAERDFERKKKYLEEECERNLRYCKENVGMTEQMTKLRVTVDSLTEAKRQSDVRKHDFEVEIQTMKKKIALLTNQLNSSHQKSSDTDQATQEVIDQLEQRVEDLIIEKQQVLEDQRKKLADLDRLRIEETEKHMKRFDQERSELKSIIKRLNQEMETSETQLQSARADLEDHRGKLQSSEAQLKKLETQITELTEAQVELKRRLEQRDTEAEGLRQNAAAAAAVAGPPSPAFSGFSDGSDDANKSGGHLELQLSRMEERATKFATELKLRNAELAKLKESLERTEADKEDLEKKMVNFESDSKELKELMELADNNYSKKCEEWREAQKLATEKQNILEEKQKSLEEIKKQLKDASLELTRCREMINVKDKLVVKHTQVSEKAQQEAKQLDKKLKSSAKRNSALVRMFCRSTLQNDCLISQYKYQEPVIQSKEAEKMKKLQDSLSSEKKQNEQFSKDIQLLQQTIQSLSKRKGDNSSGVTDDSLAPAKRQKLTEELEDCQQALALSEAEKKAHMDEIGRTRLIAARIEKYNASFKLMQEEFKKTYAKNVEMEAVIKRMEDDRHSREVEMTAVVESLQQYMDRVAAGDDTPAGDGETAPPFESAEMLTAENGRPLSERQSRQ